MARAQRPNHVQHFEDKRDFNEQLYAAVRQSPWWMISLALHAIVFVIAGLMPTAAAAPPPPPQMTVQATEPLEPPEVDKPEAPEDVDTIRPDDLVVPQPSVVTPEEVAEVRETDNDLPFHEMFGEMDAEVSGRFEGIMNNSTIGTGGGAGPFGGRGRGGDGNRGPRAGGPGAKTQDAVENALKWLASHQSPTGAWEAEGFDQWCDGKPSDPSRRPDGLGKPMYDPGVTGLSLLAFLGAGYTNRGNQPFARTVSRGLSWLRNVQDPEGCFGPRATQHFIYNHAIAALAMVEAYGMTGSPVFLGPAQKGLDFIGLARNPYMAWRYGIKPGDNDTSVTGWMMMALKSAKLVNNDAKARGKSAPFQIDEESFDGIRTWLDKMTDPDSGRVGYLQRGSGPARPQEMVDRFPTDRSESMTAVGVLARVFIGEDPRKSEAVQKGARLMSALLPTWNPSDGSIDMYYWYYATLAMFQVGGDAWTKWNAAMLPAIVQTQRLDGEFCQFKGSWDPIDPWGPEGGRVYSTAVLAMCLEVYYRYAPVFTGAR